MRARGVINGFSIFIFLSALVIAVSLIWSHVGTALQLVITLALIYVIATVGFYLFVGNSGVFPFGQVAFMMIGSYVGALFAMSPNAKRNSVTGIPHVLEVAHLSPYLACLAGGLAAALVAIVISIPLIRLSGTAASLTSFAILQVVYTVAANWQSVTDGESGLAGIPLLNNIDGVCIIAVAAIGVAILFQQSRWGRRLRASREDEVAARAVGIRVHRERRIAFVLSALIMGVAGGLYAEFLGSIVPETLYLTATTTILIMLVVGGLRSLSGAVIGSLGISALTEILVKVQGGVKVAGINVHGPLGTQEVGLGVLMLVTLLVFPRGLTGSREVTWLARPIEGVLHIPRSNGRPTASTGSNQEPQIRTPEAESVREAENQ